MAFALNRYYSKFNGGILAHIDTQVLDKKFDIHLRNHLSQLNDSLIKEKLKIKVIKDRTELYKKAFEANLGFRTEKMYRRMMQTAKAPTIELLDFALLHLLCYELLSALYGPIGTYSSFIDNECLNKFLREDEKGEETSTLRTPSKLKNTEPVENVFVNNDNDKVKANHFIGWLNNLSISSKEAIADAGDDLSTFNEYIHVDTAIQKDFTQILEEVKNERGKIVLLCGAAGDGKSHLLSYLRKKHPDLMLHFEVVNDASESPYPDKSELEYLKEEVLKPYFDKTHTPDRNLIIAINLGILDNFVETYKTDKDFESFTEFVRRSEVLTGVVREDCTHEDFRIISFADYQLFQIEKKEEDRIVILSPFLKELMDKIFDPRQNASDISRRHQDYPYKEDAIYKNYAFLCKENVKNNLIQLLGEMVLYQKTPLPIRLFLNFLHSLVFPPNFRINTPATNSQLTSSLLFDVQRSYPFSMLNQMDPFVTKNVENDKMLLLKRREILNMHVWAKGEEGADIIKNYYRSAFISQADSICMSDDALRYYRLIYDYTTNGNRTIRNFSKEVIECIYNWNGKTGRNNTFFIDDCRRSYRLALEMRLREVGETLKKELQEALFKYHFTFPIYIDVQGVKHSFNIDYRMFRLISQMKNGYAPNKSDREECIEISEFINGLVDHYNEQNEGACELLLAVPSQGKWVTLQEDDAFPVRFIS